MIIRVIDAAAHELHHVPVADPREQLARFRRPVVPGDQLIVEVIVVAFRGDFCKLTGRATVNGELAAEATLMCKMVDREVPAKVENAAK